MRKSCHIIAILLLLTEVLSFGQSASWNLRNDLERLDNALQMKETFTARRKDRIASLQKQLSAPNISRESAFALWGQLYQENLAFSFDDAMDALESQERVARESGNRTWKQIVLIDKALVYSNSGMYLEANESLSSVDTTILDHDRLVHYYYVKQRFLSDFAAYTRNNGDPAAGTGNARVYRELFVANTPAGSPDNLNIRMLQAMSDADLQTAEVLADSLLASVGQLTHDYAIASYYKAAICRDSGRPQEAVHWFVESAIADETNAVKDNASLFSLALMLLDDRKEVERAFHYTQASLEDAIFFNAKLRPWQIAQSMPAIEKAYNMERDRQIRQGRVLLLIISILALLLLATSLFIRNVAVRQKAAYKKLEAMDSDLAEANAKLQEAISELSESNAAKEEYLGLFLSMCSAYIDKLKKHLTREQVDAELKNFYNTFDNAFLQLYPNFVRDFNELLRPEERIELKKDELLNTELRIFALIRLGITQSSHIASLLRYSVNTIYNYRAQVKKAAIEDRDNFEERIRYIGN